MKSYNHRMLFIGDMTPHHRGFNSEQFRDLLNRYLTQWRGIKIQRLSDELHSRPVFSAGSSRGALCGCGCNGADMPHNQKPCDPAHKQRGAQMKRYHVISISVLMGLIIGLSVSKSAQAMDTNINLVCETTAPYPGNMFPVTISEDLTMGETVFDIQKTGYNFGATYRGANPVSAVTISRLSSGAWGLMLVSKVSDRVLHAQCNAVD
ncbi:TPA: hypothetical protein ACIBRT_003755 [Salmonella enterica subsp. enterica serovar Aberdeen]